LTRALHIDSFAVSGGADPVLDKKPYIPPRIIEYPPDQVPEAVIRLFQETHRFPPKYTSVLDRNRRFVRVSDSFCELLGYQRQELIGKTYDEFTAPKTADISTIFRLFDKLGYMQGLWMLVHRTGERILIRYESWLRSDSFIESNIEVVDHLR
jgi:PAS domain S-box-containing protein